jgi:hypothetical protein
LTRVLFCNTGGLAVKITDVATTLLAIPGFRPIQDATIPPPRTTTENRTALFVHLTVAHLAQGVELNPETVRRYSV